MNQDIILEVHNNIGVIRLNRPNKLNALSYKMIEIMYEKLLEWKDDKTISMVLLEGSGDKALCSGGDVVHLREKRYSNIEEYAFGFFHTEYCMNMLMFTYPKPIISYMNGYVMGGGVGISVGTSHRIVTETTTWAMPEMNIGLFPDVGGSYFLNMMPGEMGRYLALTSKPIRPADVMYIGAGDYFIDSNSWKAIREKLFSQDWKIDNVKDTLNALLESYTVELKNPSKLQTLREKIDYHFGFDTMEEIIDSLKREKENGDEWASKILKTVLEKSPTSLKVALKQLTLGKTMSMKECFKMELDMGLNFMNYDDFFEGVRAVLVDKDKKPNWKPATIEEVDEKIVDSFFEFDWSSKNYVRNEAII